MTTATARAEQCFVLDDSTWDLYESILQHLADRHVFVTYDRGRLELMAPSWKHEKRSRLIGKLIGIVAEELGVPIEGGGSATIRRKSLDRGLEADQWFYVSHVGAIQGRDEIDPERDPPPDLAVEVEISQRLLDREGIYRAMRVPELWRDDGNRVRMFALGDDGHYHSIGVSSAFPMLDPAHVEELMRASQDIDEMSWGRLVRDRIRRRLLK